jgi:AAHS family 4-hydroxybenzoate transporter-like MFS transporter
MSDKTITSGMAAVFDHRPVGVFQLAMCAVLLGILVIDGIDIQLLSLVAPAIMVEWEIERAAFGPALAGALIGMSLGSVIGGWLGDRFGRLPVLVASTILFGAATIVAGVTDSVGSMAVLRVISGIGFGAAAPNAIALATDWLPTRYRSLMISIMSIGTPAGGMIGATLVLAVLPEWGWRGTFYACGGLTLLVALGAGLLVRESPQWLAAKGQPDKAGVQLRKVLGADTPVDTGNIDATKTRNAKVSFLTRDNLRLNIGAGLGFFAVAFVSYALVAWTAIMLTTIGYGMEAAVGALFAFNIAAVAAAVFAGLVMNRLGTRLTLVLACTLLLCAVLALLKVLDGEGGQASVPLVHGLVGCAGGFAGAAMASIYAMMGHGYSVACRSGGLGFGMMLGRAGGILASLVGGYLLEMDGTAVWPFLSVLAVAAATGLACAFISDRHVPPRLKSGQGMTEPDN